MKIITRYILVFCLLLLHIDFNMCVAQSETKPEELKVEALKEKTDTTNIDGNEFQQIKRNVYEASLGLFCLNFSYKKAFCPKQALGYRARLQCPYPFLSMMNALEYTYRSKPFYPESPKSEGAFIWSVGTYLISFLETSIEKDIRGLEKVENNLQHGLLLAGGLQYEYKFKNHFFLRTGFKIAFPIEAKEQDSTPTNTGSPKPVIASIFMSMPELITVGFSF